MSLSQLCPLLVSVLATYGLALDYDAKIRIEVISSYVRVHFKAPTSFKTNKVFLELSHAHKYCCSYARKIIFPAFPSQGRNVFIPGENLTAEFLSPDCQGKFLLSVSDQKIFVSIFFLFAYYKHTYNLWIYIFYEFIYSKSWFFNWQRAGHL